MSWFHKNKRDLVVLGLFSILTLALTWPLIAEISTRLAGDDVDVLINPWADWWTRKALTEGLNLYFTNYLFYPQGTSLVFHSFSHVNTAISLLLTPQIGHFAAYNLTILLTYIMSGFGMYLLAKHLTGCRAAAFIAGVVFAFHPYHMFQSSHPVLGTTQFMPLFLLAFIRMIHDPSANRSKQTLLAALWFLLTALSSWHLMLMLAGWAILYLLYSLLFERTRWLRGANRYLILLAALIIVTVTPFLWPIINEQLSTDATYMAAEIEEGRGNDLLSFFTPSRLHPLFASLVLGINSRIGYTRNTPAYLGYVALILAIIGIATARRQARFWWATGLIFLILSLGSQLRLEGVPLHSFHFPWAIPIISVLRHPLRLNSLLFLSLAVLAAFGGRWLFDRLASRSSPLAYSVFMLLTGTLLFEYWVSPFPTSQPSYSPFLHQLAQEEGDFAVADLPMGRQPDKYYMFYQTIHGKKIVGGVVSRTPYDAQSFIDANPLLGALRNENVPNLFLKERLAVLGAQGIRYVIVHKRFFDSARMETWQNWLVNFPPPYYEDDMVIVYSTAPDSETTLLVQAGTRRVDTRLGDDIFLRGYQLNPDNLSAGETITVTLYWQPGSRVTEDYHVFVHLLDAKGQLVAQQDGVPVQGERPTWSWWDNEVIRDKYVLVIDQELPPGTYALSVGLYDLTTGVRLPITGPTGERLPEDRIVLKDIQIVSDEVQ
jgi:hypothetical protein